MEFKQTQSGAKQDPEEAPSMEQVDQDLSEESIKQDNENADAKQKSIDRISRDVVEKLAEALKEDWEKLAAKLGYTNDEVM